MKGFVSHWITASGEPCKSSLVVMRPTNPSPLSAIRRIMYPRDLIVDHIDI
jgi:hypothetical protein